MFSNKDIEIFNIIDKHVSDMNCKLKHPYFFTWSLPTNHIYGNGISYFCINLGKYLIQETSECIESSEPVEILYFFGRLSNLNSCTVPENIADLWNSRFTTLIQKNYFALDNAARGFHNINNSEFKNGVPNLLENETFDKSFE